MNDKETIALIAAMKELHNAILGCKFLASKEESDLSKAIDENLDISMKLLNSIDTERMV